MNCADDDTTLLEAAANYGEKCFIMWQVLYISDYVAFANLNFKAANLDELFAVYWNHICLHCNQTARNLLAR